MPTNKYTPADEWKIIGSGLSPEEYDQRREEGDVGWFPKLLAGISLPSNMAHQSVDWLFETLKGNRPQRPNVGATYMGLAQHYSQGLSSGVGGLFVVFLEKQTRGALSILSALGEVYNEAITGLGGLLSAGYRYAKATRDVLVNEINGALNLYVDPEEYKRRREEYSALFAKADREIIKDMEIIDATNLGALGGALVLIDRLVEDAFGWSAFHRYVEYVRPDGEVVRTKVSGWTVDEEIRRIEESGGKIIKYEATPSIVEVGSTIAVNLIDLFDPVGNTLFGGALRRVGNLQNVVFNKITKAVLNPATTQWIQNSKFGSFVANKIYKLEGELGVAFASIDRAFTKLFAPLSRRYNAKIELGRRIMSGIEEYITEGTGIVADLLESSPKRFEMMFGAGAVSSIRNSRELFLQRIEYYKAQGLDENAAKEQAKADWRKTQAFALWAQTGLPLDEEIVEALRKEGLTPSEADEIIKKYKEEGMNETEAEALRALVSTGLINDVPSPAEALSRYANSPFIDNLLVMTMHRTADGLTKVEEIFKLTDEDLRGLSFETKQKMFGLHVSEERLQEFESMFPMLKKPIRERVALALSVLESVTHPAERKAIADYIAFELSSRGVVLENLYRRLSKNGEKPNVYQTLVDSVAALKDNLSQEEAAEVLQTLRDVKVDRGALDGLSEVLRKAQMLGLVSDPIALAQCMGGSFIISTAAVITDALSKSELPPLIRGAKSLHDEEILLRQHILTEMHSRGWTVDDIYDTQLKSWLNGEINYTEPLTANTAAEGMNLILRVADNAGIDRNLLLASIDLQESVRHGLVNLVSETETRRYLREMGYKIFNLPQSMRSLLEDFGKRLEDMGRTEDAYRVKSLLDKQYDYDALVNVWNDPGSIGLSPPAIDFMRHYAHPFAMMYYVGKDVLIQEGRNVLLNKMVSLSSKLFKEQSPFSNEPTLIHTVRIEGTNTIADGKYTTPYVAKVINGLVDERTVWRGWLDFLNTVVKMSAVVWQPMALFRDFVSNIFAIMFGLALRPDEIWKIGKYYWKAIHAVKTHNDDFLRIAEQTPSVWGATIQIHELENEIISKTLSGRLTERLLWRLSTLPLFRDMQKLRGYSEALGKIAVYYAVEDMVKHATPGTLRQAAKYFGIDERLLLQDANSLATIVAEKYMLDYHDVTPAVQFLRRYLGIFPFITYETKMFSVLFSDIFSGRRLDSLGYFLRGIQTGQRILDIISGSNTSEEENELYHEAIKGMLPAALKRDPLTVVWVDKKGNLNVLSLSYYVPYGVFLPLFRIAQNPNKLEAFTKEAKERLGGLLPPLLEVLINVDLYSGRPIYENTDTPDEQVRKILRHLGKEIAPLVPRSLLNAMSDMNNIRRSPEDIDKALRLQPEESGGIDWIKRIFGVYQIKLNAAVEQEYKRKIMSANRMLSEGMKIYNNLNRRGDVIGAKKALEYYLKESDRLRNEAIEFLGSAFILRGFLGRPLTENVDANTTDDVDVLDNTIDDNLEETTGYRYEPSWDEYWKDPITGFNPMTDYSEQIEFLRQWYYTLRGKNLLPQNTSKEEIMDYLIQSAEAFVRLMLSSMVYMKNEEQTLKEIANDFRQKTLNHLNVVRQNEGELNEEILKTVPMALPYHPSHAEPFLLQSPTPSTTWRFSWNDTKSTKRMAEQIYSQLQHITTKPATSEMITQSMRAIQRETPYNPPSLGADIPSQAGRPPSNPAGL
ncbi:MAG: hypothetical protein QXW98_06155 [Candidatus Caldarchaeum sp.]